MRVLLSGSSGLVGSALLAWFRLGNAEVTRLVRSNLTSPGKTIHWEPEAGALDPSQLEGFDAVIHLAGESIASGRWTAARKRRIRDSRVLGTRLLAQALCSLSRPPKTFLCASAIGFYGNRGEELLNEESQPGTGFLAEVTRDWEQAAMIASSATRVVLSRFGVILSPTGGALRKMLLPFKLGLGGKLGRGDQFMSWIAIDDVVGAIEHLLRTESLHGPINFVSPQPLTNLEFTRTLGAALHRPTFVVPELLVRLAFGEMAEETLLASARVMPLRLLESSYQFRHPDLKNALAQLLKT